MDTVTQALLGAAAAQAFAPRSLGGRAWLYGAVGGVAADVDMLFEAASDPMLGIRFHRHFTHALAFIPLGGVLSSLPFLARSRGRECARSIILAATIGYATHALLDMFTSYGTVLWWPFSSVRVALDWLAIVDPIVTLVLLAAVVFAARQKQPRPARLGLVATTIYLLLGGVQHGRAVAAVTDLAEARGHAPARLRAFPLVLSNVRWRVLYEFERRAYVVDVTAPWWPGTSVETGEQIELVGAEDLPEPFVHDPCVQRSFAQFEWFTDGWIALSPADPTVFGDMRYSREPRRMLPMWGLRFNANQSRCVELVTSRPTVGDVWRGVKR